MYVKKNIFKQQSLTVNIKSNRRPLHAKCQAGLSLWPTVSSLGISAACILQRRTKQSSCCSRPRPWRNSSEKIISSMVGMGSFLPTGGSGLSSQQRPMNLPYSFKSSYNAKRSACVGFLDKAEYFFGRGNISVTACVEREAFDFLFLHLHSTSVRLRLWIPWIKRAAVWLHLKRPLGHSHSVCFTSYSSSSK